MRTNSGLDTLRQFLPPTSEVQTKSKSTTNGTAKCNGMS